MNLILLAQKLHVLSDIGALIIKALNHTEVSSPHTSGLVLLPSSFYKASYNTKNEKASFLVDHKHWVCKH